MMESGCNTTLMSYNVGSEQGDSSSAEEVESPRSVVTAAASRKKTGRFRRWRKAYYAMDRHHQINNSNINNNNNNNKNEDDRNKEKNNKCYLQHNQVLRIKEEELQIGEYLMGDLNIINYSVEDDDDDVWGSKTCILPASPLGSSKNKNY